ncbi:MAG: hypothetical protein ACREXY_27015 [Gammaproteobacteria bacterium]
MLSLVILATAATPAQLRREQTTATVRVLTSTLASSASWNRAPLTHRRERIIIEADGRLTLVRLIEHE